MIEGFRKQHAGIIVGALLLLSIGAAVVSGQEFKRFTIEQKTIDGTTVVCEQYYEACTCYGDVIVRKSYPPQYQCNGIERCTPVNETVCR